MCPLRTSEGMNSLSANLPSLRDEDCGCGFRQEVPFRRPLRTLEFSEGLQSLAGSVCQTKPGKENVEP